MPTWGRVPAALLLDMSSLGDSDLGMCKVQPWRSLYYSGPRQVVVVVEGVRGRRGASPPVSRPAVCLHRCTSPIFLPRTIRETTRHEKEGAFSRSRNLSEGQKKWCCSPNTPRAEYCMDGPWLCLWPGFVGVCLAWCFSPSLLWGDRREDSAGISAKSGPDW